MFFSYPVDGATVLVYSGSTEMTNVMISPSLGPTPYYLQNVYVNIYDKLGAIAKCDIGEIRVNTLVFLVNYDTSLQ